MTPSERARITRRKRVMAMGIGGVLAVAAGTLADRTNDQPADAATPVPVAAGFSPGMERISPPVVRHLRAARRPEPASRSEQRQPLTRPSVTWPWTCIADHESGGQWDLVTGNGYLWGLQFSPGTFDANRGALPTSSWYLAHGTAPTPAEQVTVGERVEAASGWGAWPVTSVECGVS